MHVFNRTDLAGLWINIAAAVAVTLALNGVLFAVGWAGRVEAVATHLPPDWIVGVVWTLLFALMGAGRWYIVKSAIPGAARMAWAAVAFMIWCLAYPFVTDGLSSKPLGLLANGVTLGLNVALCLAMLSVAKRAVLLFALPVLWVSFASVALLAG